MRGSDLTWGYSSSGERVSWAFEGRPGTRLSGRAGTSGTEAAVGPDMVAYRIDIRFLILSSILDFLAFGFGILRVALDGCFDGFCGSPLLVWSLRVRRDCILFLG